MKSTKSFFGTTKQPHWREATYLIWIMHKNLNSHVSTPKLELDTDSKSLIKDPVSVY